MPSSLTVRVPLAAQFTRFLTHHCADHFKRLSSSTVSYGPCQTPTLGFVVQRHEENLAFVSEPYWQIGLSVMPLGASR